ncbi:hypothetical protein DFH08DRAFT_827820 [Mycena albidolilacea]|uniref:Uncharacterized protein n=1 Tax=Mycena albidolilacea TaxID=1033008 RepID=A0AAD7E6P1_9AGAR|nr:hypothetical protein DFH08DRAFT_827820 [Mycena albidolilacea]
MTVQKANTRCQRTYTYPRWGFRGLAWLANLGFGLRALGLGFTLSKPKPKPTPRLGLAWLWLIKPWLQGIFPGNGGSIRSAEMAENPQAEFRKTTGNQIQPKVNMPSKVEVARIWCRGFGTLEQANRKKPPPVTAYPGKGDMVRNPGQQE